MSAVRSSQDPNMTTITVNNTSCHYRIQHCVSNKVHASSSPNGKRGCSTAFPIILSYMTSHSGLKHLKTHMLYCATMHVPGHAQTMPAASQALQRHSHLPQLTQSLWTTTDNSLQRFGDNHALQYGRPAYDELQLRPQHDHSSKQACGNSRLFQLPRYVKSCRA